MRNELIKFITLHQMCALLHDNRKERNKSEEGKADELLLLPQRKGNASEASDSNASAPDQPHTSQSATGTVIQYTCSSRQIKCSKSTDPRRLINAIAGTSITSNGYEVPTWKLS